jgi:hypothetical protein
MGSILTTVSEHPGIRRPDLAARLLAGMEPEAAETIAKKEALASDLHYLIHVGHVVEFQNGSLEVPADRKTENREQGDDNRVDANAEMAALDEQPAQGQPAQGNPQQRKGGNQQQGQQRQNQQRQPQNQQPRQPKEQRPRRPRDPGYLPVMPMVLL